MTVRDIALAGACESSSLQKTCTKCGRALPLDRFSKDAQKRDGRRPGCKDCLNREREAYYKRNREKILARGRARHAEEPGSRKEYQHRWYEANKDRKLAQSRRWKSENWESYSAQQREYVDRNREALNKYAREWARRNPEKVRLVRMAHNGKRRAAYDAGASTSEVRAWIVQQKPICFYCGANCEGAMEIDHFYPLCRGGRHELENLRIACRPCNRRKSAKEPHEFMATLARRKAS